MKFIVSILLTALLAFAFGLYLPWWSIALAALVVAVIIDQPPFWCFLSGFVGLFVLWLILALKINAGNDGILTQRIGALIGLGEAGLIVVTGLLGAIVGGLGAMTGSLLKKLKVKS